MFKTNKSNKKKMKNKKVKNWIAKLELETQLKHNKMRQT